MLKNCYKWQVDGNAHFGQQVGEVEELTGLISLHPLRIRRSEHLLKEKYPGLKALVLYRDTAVEVAVSILETILVLEPVEFGELHVGATTLYHEGMTDIFYAYAYKCSSKTQLQYLQDADYCTCSSPEYRTFVMR
jgi:hypothetical protein